MKLKQLAFFAVLALSVQGAYASVVWNFSYTGGATGSGQFFTGDAGSPYLVTAVTGTANGAAITGVSSYAGADNLLFSPATPDFVDFAGISFSTVGGLDWNLFYDGSNFALRSDENPVGYPDGLHAINLTVTQVPEPATLGLMGIALVGLGVARRKKRLIAA